MASSSTRTASVSFTESVSREGSFMPTSTGSSYTKDFTRKSHSRSSKKIVAELQKIPRNRSCVDCSHPFVDPSSIHVSFSPFSVEEEPVDSTATADTNSNDQRRVGVSLHDFGLTHRAFAPPVHAQGSHHPSEHDRPRPSESTNGNNHNRSTTKFPKSQRLTVGKPHNDDDDELRLLLGGHGVFVCVKCADAHRKVGSDTCNVKLASTITSAEASWIKECGGNEQCNLVFERFIPDLWIQRKPVPLSPPVVREMFVRAKYEAFAFVLPPPGPLAPSAWGAILQHQGIAASSELRDIMSFSPGAQLREDVKGSRRTSGLKEELPNRLVDYFCVVSPSMKIQTGMNTNGVGKFSRQSNVESLSFIPYISDCYPEKHSHLDMEFPEHLPNFVLPLGCHVSVDPKPPTFAFQVLTSSSGEHLFCGCLVVHDESIEVRELKDALRSQLAVNGVGDIPSFLHEDEKDIDEEDDSIVFLPKCLVIVSHHAFFDLWRLVLLGVYQRSLSTSYMPIERYIANFASEIPLPPHGRVKVELRGVTIERPAPNQLPMMNISFRPLFASLSVGNIMIVLGHLLQESKVCVYSSNLSLLCPTTEAFRSALFPFLWSGIYIPNLPLSLVELLDAPVPFFVGVHSNYMQMVAPEHQPSDVLFVDLDRDVVMLHGDLQIPDIPPRPASKLKDALEAAGGTAAYLVPNSGIKGCVMAGPSNSLLVPNDDRPTYSRMTTMTGLSPNSLGRNEVFSNTDLAYGSKQVSAFLLAYVGQNHGHLSNEDKEKVQHTAKRNKHVITLKSPVKKFSKIAKHREILASSTAAMSTLLSGETHLLDMTKQSSQSTFSTEDIRKAFLRFTVSLFAEYEDYIVTSKDDFRFDADRFVREEHHGSPFMTKVCETQMFQTFLREKGGKPTYEILFFDENIRAKKNRSKRETLKSGMVKHETPFLDDKSWKVTQSYSPPEPSKLGLPDTVTTYSYGSFPKLNKELFGTVRDPVSFAQIRGRSSTELVKRRRVDVMTKAIKGLGSAPSAIMTVAGRTAKDLDSMLFGISGRKDNKGTLKLEKSHNVPPGTKATPLSKIDTIVMNSRRKQAILLTVVVHLQACWRSYMTRRNFSNSKNQARVAEQVLNDNENARKREEVQQRAAIKIQTAQRRRSTIYLWQQARESAIKIQSEIRRRRTQILYNELKTMISRVQALVRGWQIRNRVHKILTVLMDKYTKLIPLLWVQVHTPLTLRTKLWLDLTTGKVCCLRVRLAENELHRLWSIVYPRILTEKNDPTGPLTQEMNELGMQSTIYCTCILYKSMADSLNLNKTTVDKNTLRVEETERLQIYERISQDLSDDAASLLYERLKIPNREKFKKMAFSQKIFSLEVNIALSVSTMMELFPELKGKSLCISFRAPSSKGMRRFKNADKNSVPSIDNELWECVSIDGVMKKHVKEISLLFITKVPALQQRFDRNAAAAKAAVQNPKSESTKSFKIAAVKAHNATSWVELRYSMLLSYLYES